MKLSHRQALVAVLALSGCVIQPTSGTNTTIPAPAAAHPGGKLNGVTINNVRYDNPKDALAARWQLMIAEVEKMPPAAQTLHGKALIVTPDRDRLRPLVAQQYKGQAIGEVLEFRVEEAHQLLLSEVEAITRSKAFASISTAEINDTVAPEIGKADYLIWFQVRSVAPSNAGPWVSSWQIRRAGATQASPFGVDPGVAVGAPRYASFVKSAQGAIGRLGGEVVATSSGKTTMGDADRTMIGSGSGVVIDTTGHVLTNDHVVRTCGEIRIRDAAETSSVATVQAHDGANDLALLKMAHVSHDAARMRDSSDLRQGENVTVVGYPLGEALGSGVSVVTGSLTKLVGINDDSRIVQVSAPVQPGNSGGPLVDDNGNLIGVVSSTLNSVGIASAAGFIPQNVNFAIKTSVVRTFLDANHVGYLSSPRAAPMKTADIADLARKFTVRIECRR